jgi:cytochrome P450
MGNALDPEIEREFMSRGANSMLLADPPDHTRLRKLANRAFTPKRVAELRPSIQSMVDTILDRMADTGSSDVVSDLAFPLPVAVIGELLGVPESDRAGFQPLVRRLTVGIEPFADNDAMRAALEAQDEARAYFAELLARRRAEPAEDMLTALAHARESDDSLTDDEVIATSILLFAAGFETTTNLIGNGLLALLQHPAEFDRLRADPSLAQSATEELLRWDSPVQMNARVALEPAEVAGEEVTPGQMILVLQGAANRDPDRFVDPDRLDIGRADSGPISFGGGAHHCLGAPLARLEGEIVFASLARRFAAIELESDTLDWKPGITLRGLAALPVSLKAA